jgi:hypothetical protein
LRSFILLLTLLSCAGQSFAQKKFIDGLSLKAGLKREILQTYDQRLKLPELELAKQWGKRWHASVDFSAMQKDKEDLEISTWCADVNMLYSVYATRCNAIKVGTGMSYRYLRTLALASISRDQFGNVDKSFHLRTYNLPGINLMIEDELTIYRNLSLSARAGFQYYGQDMRSYMWSIKAGYTF